jgi:hypothetical protein
MLLMEAVPDETSSFPKVLTGNGVHNLRFARGGAERVRIGPSGQSNFGRNYNSGRSSRAVRLTSTTTDAHVLWLASCHDEAR